MLFCFTQAKADMESNRSPEAGSKHPAGNLKRNLLAFLSLAANWLALKVTVTNKTDKATT